MAVIGNQVQTIPFITDTFSGNASTTNFTLTRAPASTASIAVFISGLYQPPTTYTLIADVISFVSAPANGTNNLVILHIGNGSATQVPSDGSVTTPRIADGAVTGDKLGLTSINANNIVDGAVTGVKLGLTAINANNIVDATITGAKIASNTIQSGNLTTTGVSAGTHGSSSAIPILVVDAQGRILSASNTSVTSTSVFANSSQLTANSSSGNVLIGLANTAVVASTYGGATNVASIIVDQFGRITSASNVAVSGIDAHPFVFTALGT
jgi:hypothetical protein